MDSVPRVAALIEQARKNRATDLDLSSQDLTELPESIGQLTQLLRLNLSNNQLTVLPDSIDRLTQLRQLDLSVNELTALADSIGRLTKLQKLDLASNELTALPDSIGRLTKLQKLDLASNELTALPDSISQLTQLRKLDLSSNELMALPESISRLTQLRILYLHNNHLIELPATISRLVQLRNLILHNNQLTVLSTFICDLSQLQELILFDNHLVALPDCIGQLTLLNLLDLSGNRLTTLPDSLQNLGSLWKIRLHEKEEVRLNIWDFGGQEIMHATHQFFLTQRSLYLMVLNGREGGEDADAEYWLKLIESFGADSPVIVVRNKIEEHPFDLNRRGLQQKYPAIRDFVKTDCEDAAGINELKKAIERETDRLEDLRKAFPASWFTIKDQLAALKENYLSFEDYRKVCVQLGETDQKAQNDLAGYLHKLGVVLNYKDDPRLQDTHVLNPHWVTNGIYKILNADQLEEQKGEMRLHDLAGILADAEYPAHMRRFIFDLMKKFELCFSFPEDDTHYLIPELLDKEEPKQTAAFDSIACLNFQYHYPVLPEGLLPRFIVRTHILSEDLSRWRTGVILKFEDCRGLVKADVQDKKVFISVSGPVSSRRRLLAVIRSDFERIHRDIRNLQPLEMVPLPDHPEVVMPYQELLVMERNGIKKFLKVAGSDVIELDVQELLNGVDLEGTRRKERTMQEPREAVQLFYSYSHKDEARRNELETHLKLLQRQGLIETWHDRKIEAGEEWKRKIDENLERADIILLLVSADFMASAYCYEIEMKRALERHEKGEAWVIPVILREVNWARAPFAKLQALPKDALAVAKWPDKDSAWRNVSEGIERIVEEIRKKSGRFIL